MSKLEELKKLREQKKALIEAQRQLVSDLDATREERKAARAAQAEARSEVKVFKGQLRNLSAEIYDVFSKGSVEDVTQLAADIEDSSADLAQAVRKFAAAAEQLEEL